MELYQFHSIKKTIPAGCPWEEAQEFFGTPNVDWCEPTICSYINEPANSWSNLGFILLGLWVLGKYTNNSLRLLGAIIVLMGIFSGIYHATNNAMTQYLDFLGMVLFSSFLLASQYSRLFDNKSQTSYPTFWFLVSTNVVLIKFLEFYKLPIQTFILINAVLIIFLEFRLCFKKNKFSQAHNFFIAMLLFIFAQVLAQVDLKRLYCNPENTIFHGHVGWHIFSNLAVFFIVRHLSVFYSAEKN